MFNIIKTETEGVETQDQATDLPAQDNDCNCVGLPSLRWFNHVPQKNSIISTKQFNYSTKI